MIEWIKVSAASGVRNFRMDRTFLRMIREEETVLDMCRSKERESSIWAPRSLVECERGVREEELFKQPDRLIDCLKERLPKTMM